MKILALDDQEPARLLLSGVIQSLGCEADLVANAEEAWSKLLANRYRIVVSDWQMTGVDGLELCRRIRRRRGEYVYFILVSTRRVTKENRQIALDAGVDDFLVKPVDPDELGMRLHVAERILGLTKQVQELASFLPICSYCKKIRDDHQYWREVETYFNEHQGTTFSHGVCPDCYEHKVTPQLEALGLNLPEDNTETPAPQPKPTPQKKPY